MVYSIFWYDIYIYNLERWIKQVIQTNGTNLINMVDTQSIIAGQFFSEVGPEAFIQLMRVNAE